MRIGILGSGLMGGKLGTIFARAGHDVVFRYAHRERKLKRLAREAQGPARAGTPSDAVLDAVVLLAVHWSRVNDVLKQAGDLSGKVIVSCSLPMNADDTKLVIAHTSSGAEALAKKVRKAHVVSAFSTAPSEVLFDVFSRKRRTRRRPSLLYCGDDEDAKEVAASLIRAVGFEPVDTGPLRIARYLEPFSPGDGTTRVRGG
jgi:predicted dinucleotide-binding enzyme